MALSLFNILCTCFGRLDQHSKIVIYVGPNVPFCDHFSKAETNHYFHNTLNMLIIHQKKSERCPSEYPRVIKCPQILTFVTFDQALVL